MALYKLYYLLTYLQIAAMYGKRKKAVQSFQRCMLGLAYFEPLVQYYSQDFCLGSDLSHSLPSPSQIQLEVWGTLPQLGQGRSPGRKRSLTYLQLPKRTWWQIIFGGLNPLKYSLAVPLLEFRRSKGT